MDAAIIVVGWIALVVALILTVIAVANIVVVIGHAREINRLAKVALPAAQGIAGNTATIAQLEGVLQTAGRLLQAVEVLDRTTSAIEGRLAGLGRALARKNPRGEAP